MTYIRNRKHAVSRDLSALTATAAAGLALMALPTHAQAADQPAPQKTLKGVTVKADEIRDDGYKADVSANTKATASLLDTPQTITVIKEKLFHEQAATTLTEALRNSPGVGTFYLGENGSTSTGDAIYMRGSDTSGSIFLDGIRDTGTVSRDVFNIEQVEVLKGAAGTDVGRGSATGAINQITKQPKLATEQFLSGSWGSGDFKRGTADLNLQLDRTIAVRLNVMGQDSNVKGRDHVENNRWGVAPAIGFGIGTSTRAFVDFMHVEQNNVPDGGVSTIGLPGYSSPDATRPFISAAPRVDSRNWYGIDSDHDDNHTNTATGILEHDLAPGVVVRNITRWSDVRQNYQLMSFNASATNFLTPTTTNPATWTIARSANLKDIDNEILTNQTSLRGSFRTGFISHTVSTGVEFIREAQTNYTRAGAGTLPAVSLYNPSPVATAYSNARTGAYTKGVTETLGLYLNDTMEFSPQWLLSGGIRLDHFTTKYRSVTAAGVATPFRAKDDLVSGKVGLTFKPVESGSLYASYAVTKQPPGGANFSLSATNTANANNPDVEPQTAKSYEAGTKWNVIGDDLSLNAALYRTEYSDQILQDTNGTYYRAGKKRVQGIELTGVGQISKQWAVNLGYTIMDTKVASPTNQVVTADGTTVLAYTPKSAFTSWTTYQLPFGLTVGGGANHVGKLKRGSDGAIGTPAYASAYWVFNAYASYSLTQNIDVQLNVYNLADKDYVASINKSGYRYNPGVPRSARVTANVRF